MKKVLSIFLALAMLISLIPAVFAADTETETGIKVVYDFVDKKTVDANKEPYTNLKGEEGIKIDPDVFTYDTSDGFWMYAANSQSYTEVKSNEGGGIRIFQRQKLSDEFDVYGFGVVADKSSNATYWIAYKLYIPKHGMYTLNLKATNGASNVSNAKALNVNAFIFKATEQTDIEENLVKGNNYNLNATFTNRYTTENLVLGTKELYEGEYYFVVNPYSTTESNTPWMYPHSLTLTEGDGTLKVPMISSLTATPNGDGTTTVNAVAALMSNGDTATDVTYSYSVAADDADKAEIINGNVVKGKTDGNAIIIATATKDNQSSSKSIEVAVTAPAAEPEEDQALVDAFDATIEKGVSYDAPTVAGVTVNGGVIKASESGDGTFTLTADEEDKDGNKFLYWAKGKTLGKKIISFSNELTNYMPEANDKNHILIAVYEGNVPEKEEWYNANGQRIATDAQPALPSMAGYGTAEGWDDYTDKIHVARYARQTPTAGINVTVEGENTSGGGTNLTYGETVTCTATGENFKCWTKSDINGNTEIVSMEKTYKFQAWETCTVEAIYQDDYTYNGNTMKIILDAFTAGSEKAVMAEFIGFGNSAVEKGIIWNGTKIAMTKPGTQFTLTGNAGDTFTGYAIVDNGDGTYNEITDGNVTIKY